jgi:hypothetical protein
MTIEPPFLRWDRRRPRRFVLPKNRSRRLLGRNVLFTLAGMILLACAISSPLRFVLLLSSDKLVFLTVAAFIIAVAARGLTTIFIPTDARPWYARTMAPFFLLVALAGVNAVLNIAEQIAFKVFGVDPFMPSAIARYVLLSLELVWIALLSK